MDPGTALLVIGTAVSAYGQLQAGANARDAANANARNDFQNANAARLQAIENSRRLARLGRKSQGTNRASPGGSDKLDLLEDSEIEIELGVQTEVHKGEVTAIGLENRGRARIAAGKNAFASAAIGAFATTATGFGFAAGGFGASNTLLGGQVGAPLDISYRSVGMA